MSKIQTTLVIMLGIFILYLSITNLIFQFSNPEVTQVQAFLHIPRTLLLDFNK